MRFLYSYLILSCHITSVVLFDFSHQYTLQTDITFSPCSPVSSFEGVALGEMIFSGADLLTSSVSEVMIVGWFTLRGYYPVEYPLITIQENNGANVMFQLRYSMVTKNLIYDFKSNLNNYMSIPLMARNKWYFVKLQIILGTSSSSQDIINILMYSQGETQQSQSNSYSSITPTVFSRSSMALSVGKYFISQIQPSCALVREVTIFLDPQPWLDINVSKYHQKEQLTTYLLWSIDFFYTISNPSMLFLLSKQSFTINETWIDQTDLSKINVNSEFQRMQRTQEGSKGFMIYLEFKVPIQTRTGYVYLIQIIQANLQFFVAVLQNDSIGMGITSPNIFYPMFTVVQGIWYSVLLIASFVATIPNFQLIVKNISQIWEINQNVPGYQPLELVPIKFLGDDAFYIDNFRYYQGAFVTSSSSCYIQVASNKQNDCLICQIGYVLSYKDGMKCILASLGTSTGKPGIVMDWNRTQCPPLRIYSYPDITNCVCLNQFYLDNISNFCQACPAYCNGCSDSMTCLNYDPNRDSTGQCKPGYYDQGSTCALSEYQIPFRRNLIKDIPVSNLFPELEYKLNKNTLNYNYDSSSFFMSFRLTPLTISSVDYNQIAGYIRDGIVDRFIISIKYSQSQQTFQTRFCYNSIELSCFPFNPISAWIGLWTDFQKIILLVGTYGQILYRDILLPGTPTPFIDPIVCVGTCIEINHTQMNLYSPFTGTVKQILSIINIPYPMGNRFWDFLALKGHQTILFYEYNSNYFTKTPISLIVRNQITKQSINLSSITTIICFHCLADPLKGFYQGARSTVNQSIQLDDEFSFSINIFILKQYPFLSFFTYSMNNIQVLFQLSFSEQKNRYGITVCYDSNCKSVYNCPARQNSFFFAIIQRILDEDSLEVSYIEYEIVCNEYRDRVWFYLPTPTLSNIINTARIIFSSISVYFNNIRFFQGSDFYFDYTATDNCFMYYDLEKMKCLRVKPGYALYQGQVVTPEECNKFSTSTQAVVFNKFTQECMMINTIIPGCLNYSEDLTTCQKCIDPLNSPPDCNICPQGFFKVQPRDLCQKCHPKCSECQSEYDNCTKCISEGSSPPECECSLRNQFTDSMFQCTNCSPQCGSCSDTADACTSCSEGRINPPRCTCDPSIYDLSLSTVSSCKQLICAPQCETCEFSPTSCTKCSAFRINPPDCIENTLPCSSGYFYSSHQDICIKCDSSCKQCDKDKFNCTECYDNSFLINKGCFCSDMTTVVAYTQGNLVCSTNMEVQLSSSIKDSKLLLIFQFSQSLDNIDFYDTSIDSLIALHMNQIPQETFSIESSDIEENKLILSVAFTESISGTTGTAQFLQTQYFKNTPSQVSLSISYLSIPLPFKVPMIFLNSDYSPNETLQSITDSLNSSDSIFLDFFRQFQGIFYILNTLQPCVAFLMLNTEFPPNLYQFLKVTGLMVFPKVLSAEEASQVPESYKFLGIELNTTKANVLSNNESPVFCKLGFSSAMLVNIPMTVFSNILCIILMFSIFIVNAVSLQFYPTSKVKKAKYILLKKINSNSEVSLLLVTTGILNQFFNTSSCQYLNRLSLYIAIVYLILLIFMDIYNYQNLDKRRVEQNGYDIDQNCFLIQVEKLTFQQSPSSIRKYYFFLILKKYTLSFTLVFLESVPAAVCAVNFFLLICSMIWTAWKHPYKALISNLAKVLGDLCICSVWMILWIKIIPISNKLKNAAIIPRSTVKEYLTCGAAVLVFLAIFNILYLLEFFWIQIFKNIQGFIKKRKDKNEIKEKVDVLNNDENTQEYDSNKFINIFQDEPTIL